MSLPFAAWFLRLVVALQSHPAEEPRLTPPPPDVPPKEIAERIKKAAEGLQLAKTDAEKLLVDPKTMDLHEWTAFRELIRKHAPVGALAMVTPDEPGTRLTLRGTVRDEAGKLVQGALVYAYQTSAKGWYSDKAPHVSGTAGDVKHARLFGYVRTGADGVFELRTIRPAGYPRSDLPQHVHMHVDAKERGSMGTEVLFDDDPRLTPEKRMQALRSRDVVVRADLQPDGSLRAEASFALRAR